MDTMINADELSLDMIEELLAGNRTRGGYLPPIQDFFKSGKLTLNMTELFPGKEVGNLRNVTNQNAEKCDNHPAYKVVVQGKKGEDKQTVILINLDALAAAKAAQENEQ